ncbi:MAG TPA: NrfD/PsrC family molybdoenzyme membrane anchor subunit [Thermoleophilaceae bacterium]
MTREAVRAERMRERSMVPKAQPQSYYGQPVLKEPVWTPEIPFYFYTGGLAGTSATLALLAELRGNKALARRAWLVALAGVSASPALLISDLGKPSRFLNMLRMFKVTSPMSVGSWILSGSGTFTALAVASEFTGLVPALGRTAKVASAILGLPLSTYTAGLVANTSVPVWHDARFTLPLVFAGSSAASAGAAATAFTPLRDAGPARRLAVGGAVASVGAAFAMEKKLGEIGEPYSKGVSGKITRLAGGLSVAGAALMATRGGRSRGVAIAASAVLTAGVLAERWAVFRAGFQSASDPKFTVGPQRARIDRGETRGASRRAQAGA